MRKIRLDAQSTDTQVHALRITCKKLRYALELFAHLYDPEPTDRLVKEVKRLQDVLGRFNDLGVQQQALGARFEREQAARRLDLTTAMSVGALVGALHTKRRRQRDEALARLQAFNRGAVRGLATTLFGPKQEAA